MYMIYKFMLNQCVVASTRGWSRVSLLTEKNEKKIEKEKRQVGVIIGIRVG